ncbi:MAG: nucleotidyltransferase family protein [Chloroflexota bacterium]
MTVTRNDAAAAHVRGILLAAGASSRLGQPKQLLAFGGRPLVRHVAEQALASRLAGLTVVVGHHAAEVSAALDGLSAAVVENPSYSLGQSTSLRAGLLDFPADGSAALVLLVDQPFVTPTLIDRLIALYQESMALIVAPRCEGRRGNPVLFDRELIPELLTVVGDTGAREVISRHRDQLVPLELTDDRAFQDIDTWDDYRKLAPNPAIEPFQ